MRLGFSIVNGDVQVVDPGTQDCVQNRFRLTVGQGASHAGDHAAQFQRSETESRNAQSGTSQDSPGQVLHLHTILELGQGGP